MKSVIAAAALVFTGSPSVASNWVPFGKSGGNDFFADADSLAPTTDGVVRVWVKIDYSKDRTVAANHVIQRWEFRCATHESRTTSSVAYSAGGKVLGSQSGDYAPFSEVIPDSIGQALDESVCLRKLSN